MTIAKIINLGLSICVCGLAICVLDMGKRLNKLRNTVIVLMNKESEKMDMELEIFDIFDGRISKLEKNEKDKVKQESYRARRKAHKNV